MANSTQILALINSHLNGDDEQFKKIALQIAAIEAKSGHSVLSRAITDAIKQKKNINIAPRSFFALNNDFSDLVLEVNDSYRLSDIITTETIYSKIRRILTEYNKRELLYQNSLVNRSKILLTGPSGTGKTMTASILSNELHIPLFVVRLERIITKFMGETSLKLSKVFDLISSMRGVYLFDEFDAIGSQRGMSNEVGEMRRILNSFLQMLERENSDSIIVAATNCPEILDKALFRRFDDVIEYTYPTKEERLELIKKNLGTFIDPSFDLLKASMLIERLSHSEITSVCKDTLKKSLLSGKNISFEMFNAASNQRNNIQKEA